MWSLYWTKIYTIVCFPDILPPSDRTLFKLWTSQWCTNCVSEVYNVDQGAWTTYIVCIHSLLIMEVTTIVTLRESILMCTAKPHRSLNPLIANMLQQLRDQHLTLLLHQTHFPGVNVVFVLLWSEKMCYNICKVQQALSGPRCVAVLY